VWHCTNNLTGYCSGEPEWEKEPSILKVGEKAIEGYSYGGICKLDWHNCGKFKSATEMLASQQLPEHSYRHTTILKSQAKKSKGKGKEKKNGEQAAQGQMF